MKQFKFILGILLSTCLFSSSLMAQSWSGGTFKNIGVVGQINSRTMVIDDGVFRISPTLKFSTVGQTNAKLDLLKVNQMIGFNFIIIDKKIMVDHIWLIPDSERSFYGPQY